MFRDRALVTGASGFIGKVLMSQYPEDLIPISREARLNLKRYIAKNYSEDSKPSCIIHLAALAHAKYSKEDIDRVNYKETVELAKSAVATGIKRFVYISSVSVFSNSGGNGVISCNTPLHPDSFDGKAKLSSEIALRKLEKDTGIEVVIIRPTLVYGPNPLGNIRNVTRWVERFKFLPFGAVSNNRRSVISVFDLADLIYCCVNHPQAKGKTFLAADDVPVSTKDMTTIFAKHKSLYCLQIPIPSFLFFILAYFLGKLSVYENIFNSFEVDNSKTKKILGWTPKYNVYSNTNFYS